MAQEETTIKTKMKMFLLPFMHKAEAGSGSAAISKGSHVSVDLQHSNEL
jgi:hypothetical protein